MLGSIQVADTSAQQCDFDEYRNGQGKLFDAAEYLDSPEMIVAYVEEAFESEDAAAIAIAIRAVARVRLLGLR
jgi:DNA-binding phage protein